ncbi:MAG: hypothetical protein JWO96_233 [Candidatus Saccharibacteria bacterium]|nr:hypothetical protein [Candidatus Saccharibacteria bacterium]
MTETYEAYEDLGEQHNPTSEKSPDLRRVESCFPGLEQDPEFLSIFEDPTTGKITVTKQDSLGNRTEDREVFWRGGGIDHELTAYRLPESEGKRSMSNRLYGLRLDNIVTINTEEIEKVRAALRAKSNK